MPAVVAAAAGLDADVVLVRPEARLTRRPLPPRVRTVGWVPLPDVLPACSGIVHHGGAGTTLAAMAAGVPQLLVPGAGDRRYNAELVEACGAGFARTEAAIDAAALRRLVSDEALRARAELISADVAAMPAPATLVPRLEALAG
jgi:UDP:flavonoid glycosyltransferase YjiC (YdhE family)